ncbi:MAG TPA: 4-hydroxythreonine-4-phosphate dehydrogenase PdxA [Candidatus Hydrogenedens sp.]|nr:4-hydroxythreonine-4-phosphate dehydrogenase PdxA [Candidatus Hydrogenedens sp.]
MIKKPIIGITMGDINGIGPEIIGKVLRRKELFELCFPVILGNINAYTYYNKNLPDLREPIKIYSPEEIYRHPDKIGFIELEYEQLHIHPGILDPINSTSATAWIHQAVIWALEKKLDAIVTCPITKEGLAKAGIPFDGHTTMLAEWTNTKHYRMSLFAGERRVVHHTAHMSLLNAIQSLNKNDLIKTIEIAHNALTKIHIPEIKIGIAGLNPHAGENGLFGNEELEIITPAIKECNQNGIPCYGPYPPDTIFKRMFDGEFNMVIAMYHDQGHIPMKLIAMDEGVNVTLGLPIIRTSVDHGTAFDIAGKGIAREHSLYNAIKLAIDFSTYKE